MTCIPIVNSGGRVVGHICDGLGAWKPARRSCPWCSTSDKQERRCIEALVYDGFCGVDIICSHCGFRWNPSEGVDLRLVKVWKGDYRSKSERERNKEFARSVLKEGPGPVEQSAAGPRISEAVKAAAKRAKTLLVPLSGVEDYEIDPD